MRKERMWREMWAGWVSGSRYPGWRCWRIKFSSTLPRGHSLHVWEKAWPEEGVTLPHWKK